MIIYIINIVIKQLVTLLMEAQSVLRMSVNFRRRRLLPQVTETSQRFFFFFFYMTCPCQSAVAIETDQTNMNLLCSCQKIHQYLWSNQNPEV